MCVVFAFCYLFEVLCDLKCDFAQLKAIFCIKSTNSYLASLVDLWALGALVILFIAAVSSGFLILNDGF